MARGPEPTTAVEHYNLACALQADGKLAEAVRHYGAALELKPDFASAANNLGNALVALRQPDAAVQSFRQVLELQPDHANALASLGGLLVDAGKPDEAVPLLERCLAKHPRSFMARVMMAQACHALHCPAAAAAEYRRAIEIEPMHAPLHNNLGSRLVEAGLPAEAVAAFERALSLDPAFALAHSNRVLARQYVPGVSVADQLADARAWDSRHGAPRAGRLPPPANARDPERPLRIGYVSADFRRHPVGFFMTGPLAHHDHGRFRIFCYAAGRLDAYTARLAREGVTWRDIRTLPDDAAAAAIRADGIDILVDLAGHTAGNRLTLFAMKPAPIQITAGGHTGTTGCSAIDYLVTDGFESPPGAEQGFSETLIRMPHDYVCYAPPDYAPAVGPLPAERSGTITFGCLNNIAKLNAEVAALWVKVVGAVPGSRLMLRGAPLAERATADTLRATFAAAGLDAARLVIGGGADHAAFLGFYNEIDIALDPFPYSGGLTTLEALWMGAPVVSLAGATFCGRHSLSHLTNAGLAELVAATPAQYVAIASNLAHDHARLAALRQGLRARMQASPLLDAAGYTRALEEAYRAAWRRFCEPALTSRPA